MPPFISIITPTLQRESLIHCCRSVDDQSFGQWEHIVVADSDQTDYVLWDWHQIRDERRLLMRSSRVARRWGNFQRWQGWEWAAGDYLLYLDDDNTFARQDALSDIAAFLESTHYPDWAVFPIMRHGRWFFNDPPGMCMTDTANVVVKRELGRWPDIEAREADGVLVEELKAKYKYAAFPECKPIIVMEKSSNGI